jgi:acetyl-CoA C-acetyltransferase
MEGAMIDPRSPCIIGVARRTLRADEGLEPEPLDLWEEVSRAAAADSGGRDVLGAVDDLALVYSLSWQYDDAAARLAERLELGPGRRRGSGMSGTSSQKLLNEAAEAILAGKSEMALVVGGELLDSRRRLKKEGRKPAWSHPAAKRTPPPFEDPFHPAELAHEIFQAYLTFAMFDVARRAHLGRAPEDYRREAARTLAPLSRVAAANPEAWFRVERSAEEIATVSPRNRMVSYPYAKHMVAIMDVDMGAAVLVTSHEKAEALGVPRERRVYLRGWCHANDPPIVAAREDLWRSVAMEEASREAFARAGVGLGDVAHLDLYSCFASSLHFARDALGLEADDARPLTVTGGLPYHGGPGSNYCAHSIATMVERLRAEPGAFGLVSGVGMHMAHHVFALYSTEPGSVEPPDAAAVQKRVDGAPRRALRDTAAGSATVRTYSVVHGREGPRFAAAVCDLPSGERCYARSDDPALLAALESEEWVGRDVELASQDAGVNRIQA